MSTYESADEIRRRQLAEHAVRTKAAEHPDQLDDEDLKILPGDLTAELMAAGSLKHLGLVRRRRARRVMRALSRGVRARQARTLRMLAAMSSKAVKMDWAAMPRTRRRAGWARASWAGSLMSPLRRDRGLDAEPGWSGRWLQDLGASVAGCQRGLAQRAHQPGMVAGCGAG